MSHGIVMKTLIRLKIKRFEEKNQEYFVATSYDLQGLVAEGRTIDEVIDIAEDAAKIILELNQETNNNLYIKSLPSQFEYPLIMEV